MQIFNKQSVKTILCLSPQCSADIFDSKMYVNCTVNDKCVRQWTHFCSNPCWWTLLVLLCQNNPSTSQVQHKDANETLVITVQVCGNHVVTSTKEVMILPVCLFICQQDFIKNIFMHFLVNVGWVVAQNRPN